MSKARKYEKYDLLIYRCHGLAPLRTAVAHPCDETSLGGARLRLPRSSDLS